MQIQISWLLQKPTDLDLHCLLRQGTSCSAREGLNIWTPPFPTIFSLKFECPFHYPLRDLNITGWMVNIAIPDQMPHSAASHLGLPFAQACLSKYLLCFKHFSERHFFAWRFIKLKIDLWFRLQKHTYSNILKILPPKNENFQIKNSDIFQISA